MKNKNLKLKFRPDTMLLHDFYYPKISLGDIHMIIGVDCWDEERAEKEAERIAEDLNHVIANYLKEKNLKIIKGDKR